MFSTVTVEVVAPLEPATDAHGNAVHELGKAVEVAGVLPQPAGPADLSADRPEGARVAMTFHWPKADRRSLRRCLVRYGGRIYRVIGDPLPFAAGNCPGQFDRAVACEAVDG